MWVQIWLAIFGLTALYCALGNNPTRRKAAPYIGLCAEVGWFYYAVDTKTYGIMVLSVAYASVYLQALWMRRAR